MTEIISFCEKVFENEIFQNIFKIVLVTLLSGVIGLEREKEKKPAGFRTYMLVGISSVLVMLCGIKISNTFGNNDPSRMPAQLLSGIGFIGAGTILSNGFRVKGLTTATAILAVTCIGLTVGAGLYGYAILATLAVYIILQFSSIFTNTTMNEFKFKIKSSNPRTTMELVNDIVEDYEMEIRKVNVVDSSDNKEGSIVYTCRVQDSSFNKNQFLAEVLKISKISQIQEM